MVKHIPEHIPAALSLGAATTREIPNSGATLLVPLGSTEQHGPHLPLDTDTRIASAIAQRAADRLQADGQAVFVAPALPYGSSGEHAGFAGTLSIGTDVLTQVLVELGRSATAPDGGPFTRVVFVNGHGGNHEALTNAVALLRSEGRSVDAWWPPAPVGAGFDPSTDTHAGHIESSILLALAPELVHLDRAAPGTTRPLRELLPTMRTGGVKAVSPNGVLGDPTTATAIDGERFLTRWSGDLVRGLQHRG